MYFLTCSFQFLADRKSAGAIQAADWIRLTSVIVWPILVAAFIAIFVMFARTRDGKELLRRIIRVKGGSGGLEVELTPETASRVREQLENYFSEYRNEARLQSDQLVRVANIPQAIRKLAKEYIEPNLSASARDEYRCTIYVPDVLFTEGLYQLIDYYPKGDGKNGRTFSTRFGIIGMAWRLNESQLNGNVDTSHEELVKDWGMTRGEVEKVTRDRKSVACIILRDGRGHKVGAVYVDSRAAGAFDDKFEMKVGEGLQKLELAQTVANVSQDMRRSGPAIKVFDSNEQFPS